MQKLPRRVKRARSKSSTFEATTLLAQHPFAIDVARERSLPCVRDDISVIASDAGSLSRFPLHPSRSQKSIGTPQQRSFLPAFNSGLFQRWFQALARRRSEIVMPAKAGFQVRFRFKLINRMDSGFHRNGGIRVNSLSADIELLSLDPTIAPFISDVPKPRRCR